MSGTPKRRWFRFSLRTLFVVVTVFACWLGYHANWIHQRRRAAEWISLNGSHEFVHVVPRSIPATLPWSLRILGEQPRQHISFETADEDRVRQIRGLFPEAIVTACRPWKMEIALPAD